MSITSGIRSGVRSGVRSGLNPSLGVTVDGTSGKGVPASASEWSSLGVAAPSSLWLCQEAAGNLADSAGAGARLDGRLVINAR